MLGIESRQYKQRKGKFLGYPITQFSIAVLMRMHPQQAYCSLIVTKFRKIHVLKNQNKFYKITRQVYNGPRVVKSISNQKIIFSKKWSLKKALPNYTCHKHNLHWFAVNYLTKASCSIPASSLKDFLSKGTKSAKNA